MSNRKKVEKFGNVEWSKSKIVDGSSVFGVGISSHPELGVIPISNGRERDLNSNGNRSFTPFRMTKILGRHPDLK
ncbi:hypothetical protein [Marinifilum fragile]|uniref:hypothetical protein n=1 Tax=Marinifilum fragile TaxID=570161 RepID=UPI002AA691E8|nr:hypothetical protein [Marinifilum fragile]